MTSAPFAPLAGQIIDITLPLSPSLPVWPGDPAIETRPMDRIAAGAQANTTQLVLPTHCGTHVDPPRHVIDDGFGSDQMRLDALIGPAWVAQIAPDVREIGAGDLEAAAIPADVTRLLLRTRNSARDQHAGNGFDPDFAALAASGAEWCLRRGISLIGVDGPGIERFESEELPVHHALLAHGVVVLEGLDLSAAPLGPATLICLPLRIADGDGAPARAVLVTP